MKKQIKKWECEGRSILTLFLFEYHGEYDIPSIGNMEAYLLWNGSMIEEAFESVLSKEQANKLLYEAFVKRWEGKLLDDIINDHVCSSGNVWQVTVWCDSLDKWLTTYQSEIVKAIEEASGDDDFYDYMPNFVDSFRQVCELLDRSLLYNDMIKPYLNHEREYEFYVENLS